MRKTVVFMGLVLFVLNLFGQNSGLGFNYQAVVRGADGFVIPSQSVELRFLLMPGQTATQASWEETHSVTTDVYGTISVTVGKGTKAGGVAAAFTDVNFAAVHYWLKVEIKEGGNYRELSYTALASVPYAEVASNASMMPVGTVVSFMGAAENIPEGWLLCDGREISRSNYPNLYVAIGTAWGYGDNATTFNLPDLRGVFERGVSGTSGKDTDATDRVPLKDGGNGGNNVGSYQGDAIRNITGRLTSHACDFFFRNDPTDVFYNGGKTGDNDQRGGYTKSDYSLFMDVSRSVPTGSDNRPANVYVYKIIKY
jgi:hypothetical protein